MADYYCRLCNDFVYGDEAEPTKHYSGYSNQGELLLYESLNCPTCKSELIELADDCVCGQLKLETDILCRRCKKVAESEWNTCVESVYRQIRTFKEDAIEVMAIYVDKEILKR